MINNKDNTANDNTITNIFIRLFSVLMFAVIVCFCVFAYLSGLKIKNYLKINILTCFAIDFVVIIKIKS